MPQEATLLRGIRRVWVGEEKGPMNETIKSVNAGSGPVYDEAFKRNAVDLSFRGDRTVTEVAASLGVAIYTLTRWRKRYGPSVRRAISQELTPEQKDEEIRRLRAEVDRLKEREIILKKSLGIFLEPLDRSMPGSRR